MAVLNYKDAEAILDISRILERINCAIDKLEEDTSNYNATMQDNIAREATKITEDLREEVRQMEAQIDKSATIAREAMAALGEIEDGGIRG